jgi:thiamine kinase-like enzyme
LILKKVYRAGFGPKPIAFDPETNSIIMEFLDIPAWTIKEIGTATSLEKFGETIRKIHEFSPVGQLYHIKDLLDRYWYSLEKISEIRRFKLFFESTRKKLDAYDDTDNIRFCHNDLCYGHFLKGKTIIFLDWEMAGMNDIYSDLAGFIHFHHLNRKQTDLFLRAYSQKPFNKEKLAVHQDAILLRELLWVITKLQEGYTEYFYTDYRERCLKKVMNRQEN